MVRARLCRALVAAVVCVGTGALTTGVGHAQGRVLSDTITFSGIVQRGRLKTIIQVQKCALTSDGEPGVFVCQAQGILNNFGPPTGTFNAQSADGQIQSNFSQEPGPTPNTFTWRGSATEMDAPDPGQPPPPYSAIMKGLVTEKGAVPVTITGKMKVKESPTSP